MLIPTVCSPTGLEYLVDGSKCVCVPSAFASLANIMLCHCPFVVSIFFYFAVRQYSGVWTYHSPVLFTYSLPDGHSKSSIFANTSGCLPTSMCFCCWWVHVWELCVWVRVDRKLLNSFPGGHCSMDICTIKVWGSRQVWLSLISAPRWACRGLALEEGSQKGSSAVRPKWALTYSGPHATLHCR